jgi:hypothetical protein
VGARVQTGLPLALFSTSGNYGPKESTMAENETINAIAEAEYKHGWVSNVDGS